MQQFIQRFESEREDNTCIKRDDENAARIRCMKVGKW